MFKIVLLATIIGCALAAPAPYENPAKSGVLQETSKYHSAASHIPTHDAPAVKPPVVPVQSGHHHEAVNTGVVGPTPVPVVDGAHKDVHPADQLRATRDANHTPEHKHEEHELKEKEGAKLEKPEDVKKVASVAAPPQIHKRESVPEKDEHKTHEHDKEHAAAKHEDSCGSACKKENHQHKRGVDTKATSSSEEDVNAKHLVLPPVKKFDDKRPTTPKTIVKREDVTTQKASEGTTASPVRQIIPTAVHTSFSHTWTRPDAQPAAAIAVVEHKDDKEKKDEKVVPAASETKPIVVATIDPLKPVHDAQTPSTTTIAPSTTHAAPTHRVRRGTDETEEQDAPQKPKPTKAWWRSLDLNKKEVSPKKVESDEAHDAKKPVSTTAAPAVVVATEDKKEKVNHKRETAVEEKKPSTGTPVPSTQKPNRGIEQVSQEDNKPPQFVRPVPVSHILGQKHEAETVHARKESSSSEEASKEKKSEEKHENHQAAAQKSQTKQN